MLLLLLVLLIPESFLLLTDLHKLISSSCFLSCGLGMSSLHIDDFPKERVSRKFGSKWFLLEETSVAEQFLPRSSFSLLNENHFGVLLLSAEPESRWFDPKTFGNEVNFDLKNRNKSHRFVLLLSFLLFDSDRT